ncbi:unnamed protein product, partial [marine sediment metagenome]
MFERIKGLILGTRRPELDPYQLESTAEEVVAYYFQSRGQSQQERLIAIKAAAKLARVEVVFTIENDQIIPHYPIDSPWVEFRRELKKCFPLGRFEREVAAVQHVIRD